MIAQFFGELFGIVQVVEQEVPRAVATQSMRDQNPNGRPIPVRTLIWRQDPILIGLIISLAVVLLISIIGPNWLWSLATVAVTTTLWVSTFKRSSNLFRIDVTYVGLALAAIGVCIACLVLQDWTPALAILSTILIVSFCFGIISAMIAFQVFQWVGADELGVREFFVTSCFTNCLVFAPESISNLIKVSGTQTSFFTPGKDATDRSDQILVQVKQGDHTSDEQLIVLQIVGRLPIFSQPWLLIQAYLQEFRCRRGETHMVAQKRVLYDKIIPDVRRAVKGVADEALQGQCLLPAKYASDGTTIRVEGMHDITLEVLLTEVDNVNRKLLQVLHDRLSAVAFDFDFATIEAVEDVRPNGAVESRSAGARAEQQGKARIRQADADLEASKRELARDLQVAVAELETLKQQRKTERERAQVSLQLVKVLKQSNVPIDEVLKQKLLGLSADDLAKVVGSLGANVSLIGLDGVGNTANRLRALLGAASQN